MTDTCVLYVVWNSSFLKKAYLSMESFRKFHPDIDVAIVTDQTIEDDTEFKEIHHLDEQTERHITKVYNLSRFFDNTRYTNILYLDADTYICGDLSGLFALTDKFDLALAHAPMRRLQKKKRDKDLPSAYADFNSGVMMIKRTERMKMFLQRWHVDAQAFSADQPALCELLYALAPRISVCTIPPEYNARIGFPCYFQGEVKILHAQGVDLEIISKQVNKNKGMRIWHHGVKN